MSASAGAPGSSTAGEREYRYDIDALRGIAVLVVVLYHAGVPGFQGGYVGVDVFFVISGYLITQQLLKHSNDPLIPTLKDFYARRTRRILPALSLLLFVVLALGAVVLLPTGEQQDLGRSAVATALLGSNVFFWHEARNYFAIGAESQPLLHTWSLAVEEQFYLVWPFLVLLIARVRPKLLLAAFAVTCMASFVLSVAWLRVDQSGAFYNTPSRVWELGVGAVLAAGMWIGPSLLAWVGVGSILLAAVAYQSSTLFPGVAALLPVGGAAAVIASRARPIGGRLMVALGRVSYAWYLWHWPALVFVRDHEVRERHLVLDLSAVVVALGLAIISTRFVEEPLRRKTGLRGWPLVRWSAATVSLSMVAAVALYASARSQFHNKIAPASIDCIQNGFSDASCRLGNGPGPRIVLTGDSHANQWSPALALWASNSSASVFERSVSGCPTILHSDDSVSTCGRLGRKVLDDILTGQPAAKGVVFSAMWESLQSSDPTLQLSQRRLERVLDTLEAAGIRVLLIGESPIFPFSVPLCVRRRGPESCRIARPHYRVDDMLTRVASTRPNVRFWSPALAFCDTQSCTPLSNGIVSFRDDNHLSRGGAEFAEPALRSELNWLLQGP